jgi:hypothetical protein
MSNYNSKHTQSGVAPERQMFLFSIDSNEQAEAEAVQASPRMIVVFIFGFKALAN